MRHTGGARVAQPVVASYTVHDSPVGALVLAATPVGVVTVAGGDPLHALAGLEDDLGAAPIERAKPLDVLRRQLDQYFAGRRRSFDVPIDPCRSIGFHREVLDEVCHIPWGAVLAYGEVAELCGRPRAARAVGTAMASNPITIVRPCHRVVLAGGRLGGYGGRPAVKRFLLRLEGVELPD